MRQERAPFVRPFLTQRPYGTGENLRNDRNQLVVVNEEGQHSIYPVGLEIPAGWQPTGFEGGKSECLAHIDEVWTDMRPFSARPRMNSGAA
ncbi:MbtH family protein [Streptomyces microflavus]|uniref:MbtH family protein n=1 Tax=Streptomyces microflavus TaxID=1919 RepID=UPI003830617A